MTRLTLIVNLIFILSSTADAAAASSSSKSVSSSSVSSSSDSSSSSSSSIAHTSCGCCNKKKPASCPKHEELSECVQNLGRAQNCTQKNRPIPYVAVPKESCKKGCVCVLGFFRDSSGKCIPENKCPVVCASDEEFSNCTQALCRRLNCSQQKYPVACASVAEGSCESGCVCQSGLLRTASGTCVSESQCYGDLVCDDTEVVNSCPKKCDNDFCPKSEGDYGGYCSEDQNESDSCGEPVCVCRFNYKRSNENDTCIPTRDCPAFECSGENEEYNSCPPFCPTDDCSQATPTGRCPLIGRIGIVLECKPACRCISGYWRNNGVCVPYAECPGKCPTNEKYSSCIQGECRALDCTQKGQPIACPDIAEGSCQQGCVCVEGTLRAADGSCVPEDECPVVCPAYEEFSNCTQAICRQLNCSQQGQPLVCAAVAEGSCLSGCVCQSGYLRTAEGTCVPENQCYGDLVCEDNEVVNICPNYSLGDYCPKNEEEAKLSPKVFSEPCAEKPECTCRFNYKKDDNGTCIPTRDCPPFECSGENEEYNSCPPLCPTDDCSQATPTGRCPLPGRIGIILQCRPACRCISGYWKNNGVCVPYAECPGICPTNEKYSSCIQGECRALDCTQKGQPIACPGIAEGSCQQGCVCVEGTLRAADGSCVSEDKCPVVCPANEEFNNCTQAICRHLNCSQQGQPFVCAAVAEGFCLSGCVCQSGYLRTDDGTCVPENQCYPESSPSNEE